MKILRKIDGIASTIIELENKQYYSWYFKLGFVFYIRVRIT